MYISCRTPAHHNAPSLAAYDLTKAHRLTLITGLQHASGIALAPDGSLWLGEDHDRGLIWRIAEPDRLPADIFIDRERPEDAPAAISALPPAGVFAHAAIAFSKDGRYAYLADAADEGALFRLQLASRRLQVLHDTRGWLSVPISEQARSSAKALDARMFHRITDLERLPDGRLLLAERDGGRVLALDDRHGMPRLTVFLHDARIVHPLHLAWDTARQWLWLSDDHTPSGLWRWDGRQLARVARHQHATISGIWANGQEVLIHLQNRVEGAELTLRLHPRAAPSA
ncbi:MAG: hypothetical protein D6678_03770 [Zetaproteobacteria bacterium]|nr:MAG: hypothetical protein D6678_03770 [Zetaproteobacteria bacterium]